MAIIPFEKLGRRAELIGPMYVGCIVGLAVMAALLVAIEPATETDPESQFGGWSDGFWFVWVTFHSCAYGDILPTTDTGRIIAALCSGAGYLFFIFVCLTTFIASQQPSGTPAATLRASVIEGFKRGLPAYGCVLLGLVVLGIFFDASDAVEYSGDTNVDMPTLEGIFFAWNTFHHASYGDRYPVTSLGCLVAGLLQIAGFMFPPYALACALTDGAGGGGAAAGGGGLGEGMYAGAPS